MFHRLYRTVTNCLSHSHAAVKSKHPNRRLVLCPKPGLKDLWLVEQNDSGWKWFFQFPQINSLNEGNLWNLYFCSVRPKNRSKYTHCISFNKDWPVLYASSDFHLLAWGSPITFLPWRGVFILLWIFTRPWYKNRICRQVQYYFAISSTIFHSSWFFTLTL